VSETLNSIILEFYKIRAFEYNLQFLPLKIRYNDYSKKYSDYINSINLLAEDLNFYINYFNHLVDSYIKCKENEDMNILNSYVQKYYDEIKQKVIKIPNNIDKAYDNLRALVQNHDFKDEYRIYDVFVY